MSTSWLHNKTILLTGAAGFIGSHLSDFLLENGATVVGVDSFLTGSARNIAHLKDNPKFIFIEADVTTDPKLYLPASLQIDGVLHFASPASPPRYQAHPVTTYLVNSYGTHLLLTHLKENFPEARFLFASTSEAYGDPAIHPQTEEYWGNVNPNGVRSCYDEAKRLGESICGVHHRDFGMDVRIVRIFNTYGPRMDAFDGRVIPNLVNQALEGKPMTMYGDGSQTRSYCYVSDLVNGIVSFLCGDAALSGQTINLGNPEEKTILQTAEAIKHALDPEPKNLELEFLPLPKDDPTRRRPDVTKAEKLLGWSATVPFEVGIQKTIEYFKAAL